MDKHNPYRLESPEDRKKKIAKDIEIKNNIKAMTQAARECLSDDRFKKYRAEYEKGRATIMKLLAETSFGNPVDDAFFMRVCLAKLTVIGELLERVEIDAKREVV
jgi:hypothetical protein